jgi:alpha-tubulin suppressor-like RCC1 family protein
LNLVVLFYQSKGFGQRQRILLRADSTQASASPISLYAFGEILSGQLGLGPASLPNQYVPEIVDVNAPVRAVAAGSNFPLFVTAGGEVFSTGYNNEGQLGLGHTSTRYEPQKIAGVSDAVSAAGNNHSLVLTVTGA